MGLDTKLYIQIALILKMKPILVFLALIICNTYQEITQCTQLNFLPMPKQISCNIKDMNKQEINPCSMLFILKLLTKPKSVSHFGELIEDQMYKTFKCRSIHFGYADSIKPDNNTEMVVQIEIIDPELKSAFTTKQESYSLSINKNKVSIQAKHYVGFIRGLETFLQSITCNSHFKQCHMVALPIQIQDEPLFEYRGILIDTSRHFLPTRIIKETIDAMMYNKFNILHWHIVDEDSFPLVLESHPEIAEHASFSIYERYSTEQVKEIVQYAMLRGVRIIPEIDTPGHAASWARAPKNSDVACTLSYSKYKGPLDITLEKTYQLVKQVFKEIFQLFPDPYVHLGGDEVQLTCLKNKTEFLRLEKITQQQMQIQYRKKQKKMLKQLNSSKKFIYWTTDAQFLPVQADDIAHWWGTNSLVPQMKNRKIIISQYRPLGQLYIDMGVGNILGTQYYNYATWLDIYNLNVGKEIQSFSNKDDVIGVQLTLWSEVSNQYSHHLKIWIRSSSMAERAWTSKEYRSKPDFFRRIVAHERLMNRRGIPTAPATCQQCQKHPHFC